MWNGSIATDLGTPDGTYSSALAINNAGQVAGYVIVGNAVQHATVWNGSTATDLGTLGGTYSSALAINNAGQVAGNATIGSAAQHATVWNGSTVTDLGTLGGTYSSALSINNAGQVAGYASTGNAVQHATLWNGSTATDLNSFLDASIVSAGWVLQDASGINDNGWVVGSARNSITGEQHAYLLSISAVPEPESYAMLLAGLGLMGWRTRQQKQKKMDK